ncbi:MAG: hypothetical protein J6C26_02465 [Clostridia bacterium]|nr:hypothetical protein [Clostridia bacterium]
MILLMPLFLGAAVCSAVYFTVSLIVFLSKRKKYRKEPCDWTLSEKNVWRGHLIYASVSFIIAFLLIVIPMALLAQALRYM